MLKRISAISLLCLIYTAGFAFKIPRMPQDPSIKFKSKKFRSKVRNPKNSTTTFKDSNKQSFAVEITYTKGITRKGVLSLWIKKLSFTQKKRRVSVKLKDLKSIDLQQWKGYEGKNNAYIFYPVKIAVTLKNKKVYITNRLPDFHKLVFSDHYKKYYLFTYFYDYWEKGKWHNSGKTDKNYPEKNPHPACVVKIEFL